VLLTPRPLKRPEDEFVCVFICRIVNGTVEVFQIYFNLDLIRPGRCDCTIVHECHTRCRSHYHYHGNNRIPKNILLVTRRQDESPLVFSELSDGRT